jgi:hypothetical protein
LLPTSVKVRPLAAASRRSNRTRNHRDINKWHSAARVHSPAMSHKHPHDFGQGETARSRVPSLAAAGRRSNRTRNHRDINKWHSALRRGLTVTTVTRGLRICDPLDTCWWTCVHPFLSEMCREERCKTHCLSVFPSEGLCRVLVWNCGVFRSGGCGLSTRPHRPHELSSIPNGLVFL